MTTHTYQHLRDLHASYPAGIFFIRPRVDRTLANRFVDEVGALRAELSELLGPSDEVWHLPSYSFYSAHCVHLRDEDSMILMRLRFSEDNDIQEFANREYLRLIFGVNE